MANLIKFQIQSYKVEVQQDAQFSRRKLELTSVALPPHNIIDKAFILFVNNPFEDPQFPNSIGLGFNVEALNFNGSQLNLSADLSVFDGFYQVLSTEKPVFLECNYEPLPTGPKSTTKVVTAMRLTTGMEFPGDFEKRLSVDELSKADEVK